jgi:hypothetical protein
MPDFDEKINRLQARLDKMVEYQDYFYREINLINDELKNLKTEQTKSKPALEPELLIEPLLERRSNRCSNRKFLYINRRRNLPRRDRQPNRSDTIIQNTTLRQPRRASRAVLNLEEFVGRNLISVIG